MDGMHRKVLLDKSFLQAEGKPCNRLCLLRKLGCVLVVSDTLVYELLTGGRPTLWEEAQRKLRPFAAAVEVWRHASELLQEESKNKSPIKSPMDDDLTARMTYWLGQGAAPSPAEKESVIARHRQQREGDSTRAIAKLFERLCVAYPGVANCVANAVAKGETEALRREFADVLRSDFPVRLAETVISKPASGAPEIGPQWFAFQYARSLIAFWFDYLSKTGGKGRSQAPSRDLVNSKFDAEYTMLLNYASAFATNDSRLAEICGWLYPEAGRKVFSASKLDLLAPTEGPVRRSAYQIWDRAGREQGHDLADGLLAERTLWAGPWDSL